jgi:hypothetical protein
MACSGKAVVKMTLGGFFKLRRKLNPSITGM